MSADKESRALQFLGLCMRAGQIVSGQEACVNAVRNGDAAVVLLDKEASENTTKRISDACSSHETPLFFTTPGELGHAIGKPGRMVVALEKGSMGEKVLSYFKD